MLYILELSQKKLKVIFSSVLMNVSEVIEDSISFLKKNECEFDLFTFKLALAEGLTNALKHGNSFNPNLNVTYTLDLSQDKMIMTFEDQGEGFDWRGMLCGEAPGDVAESGRGIFLMENYGFKLKYNEKGNMLILVEI